MEGLDRDRFIMLFRESYGCGRDIIASLFANEKFELTRMVGQTEDLSWFTGEYFERFYDHVSEVYYYNTAENDTEENDTEECAFSDEWTCMVKLDNGFHFFMKANTDMCSGFTTYGCCSMWASTDIDQLLTFGLTDVYRKRVEKAQTDINTQRLLAALAIAQRAGGHAVTVLPG